MNTNDSIFAVCRDRNEVKIVFQTFLQMGFKKSDLKVFQAKPGGPQDFVQVQRSQIHNGAIFGASLGALLLGSFVFFAPEMVNGNPALVKIGAVLLGGVTGAIGGVLVGIGTPDPAPKRYGQYLEAGGILLSVHAESPQQIQKVNDLLLATGGQDIQIANETKTWEDANLEMVELEQTNHLYSSRDGFA